MDPVLRITFFVVCTAVVLSVFGVLGYVAVTI